MTVRRFFIALMAVTVLSFGACAKTNLGAEGTSSGSSSSGTDGSSSSGSSSSDGSSGSSSSDGSSGSSSSDGSSGSSSNGSSNGGSSQDGTSSGGSSSSGGGGDTGGNDGTTATTTGDFTTPEPRDDGTVVVPDEPPKEVRNESPLERLRQFPPVPRSCLDDDLTLLDIFVPGAAIPVRLVQCLIYVGTIARVPSDFDGGSSENSGQRVMTKADDGRTVQVPIVPPYRVQRVLKTIALLLLIVAVSITIGYTMGARRREREDRIARRVQGE